MPATKRGGRKRAPIPPPAPSGDDLDELGGGDDEPEERPATLDALLASIAGDSDRYSVHLYRKRAGRPEYIVKLSLEEFSLDNLRERFGGGDYEVRILRRDDRNVERFYRTVSVVIAGAPKLDVQVQPATSLPPGGPVAIVAAPAPDRLDRLEKMVLRLAKRLEQPTTASPLDMLEKVGAIVQSFRKNDGGGSDVMQWLKLGLTLGAKNGGGQPDGFDKFLGELAGPFAQLLTQPNGAPVTMPPNVMQPPRTQPAAPAPGDPAAAKLVPVWLQLVTPYLGFVYQWARAGDDPKGRAQMALAMIPQNQLDAVATAAEAEDFVTGALAALPPAFQQPEVREWARQFLTALEAELTEPVPENEGGADGTA